MKIVDLKCPKCSGQLIKDGEHLVCKYCRSVFAIDYDESDVEYERLQTEDERADRQLARDKELLAERYRLAKENRQSVNKGGIMAVVIVTMLVIVMGIFFVFKIAKPGGGSSSDSKPERTEEPKPDYGITADDIDTLKDFIKAGKTKQMNIKECASLNENGVATQWDKTDAKFLDAYLITDIPNVKKERESNRLVLIYEVTWHNERYGDQTCYDAVYFEGLQVNPKGGFISDYAPQIIWRSDAAWGWGMAYSFEDYDQCYLENVTSLGGTVTEVSEKSK